MTKPWRHPVAFDLVPSADLDRVHAIVEHLHPDHWPAGLRWLAWRIEEPGGRVHFRTTGLALALVGRDPDQRPSGVAKTPMTPKARRAHEALVLRVRSLRVAILAAMAEARDG